MTRVHVFLGGGFKYLLFSPLYGEDSHFEYSNIFEMGWNHQLVCVFLEENKALCQFHEDLNRVHL